MLRGGGDTCCGAVGTAAAGGCKNGGRDATRPKRVMWPPPQGQMPLGVAHEESRTIGGVFV